MLIQLRHQTTDRRLIQLATTDVLHVIPLDLIQRIHEQPKQLAFLLQFGIGTFRRRLVFGSLLSATLFATLLAVFSAVLGRIFGTAVFRAAVFRAALFTALGRVFGAALGALLLVVLLGVLTAALLRIGSQCTEWKRESDRRTRFRTFERHAGKPDRHRDAQDRQ